MKKFALLFFFLSLSLQAQFHVIGVVKDASNQTPLPFATITTNDEIYTISDVEGRFTIQSKSEIKSLNVSYIGYEKTSVLVSDEKTFYTILLTPVADELNEVNITNENPAIAIIKKTIANKNLNNPQKKLKSFEFKSYNKLLITANVDSIDPTIDTVFLKKNKIKLDSANYKFKEIISKQHLFQTEKVSKFEFADDILKEIILGTKMSGFKKPIYELIGFNLQSFSIYENSYELFLTKYKSPIDDDALRDYNYKLLDSVIIDGRQTLLIYFKNKKKRKSSGLEGILYIDQQNYAVAKAVMQIQGVLNISGVNEFHYVREQELWLPINQKFHISKGKNDQDINILIGTIKFKNENSDTFSKTKKEISDLTFLESETNYFDFKYNIPLEIKNPYVKITIKDDAINKPEQFWNQYRKDTLDVFTTRTYASLDSISVKKRIESRLNFVKKILLGYVPIGFSDLNLKNIISFNNYEGFRLGIGGTTNDKFSKKFRIDSYVAYGTKDKNVKFSVGAGAKLDKHSNSWLNASYTDDVRQIATTEWAVDGKVFKIYDPNSLNYSTFYKYQTWKTDIESKIIPKTESVVEFSNSYIQPKFNYAYYLNGVLYTDYYMTTAKICMRWNPNSDYMQTPSGLVEVVRRYPKITLQFTQSLPDVLKNDFTFSKIDFRTDYDIKYLNGQQTNFLIEAGLAIGDIPLTHLYSTSPNNLNESTVWQRITFAGKNTFETMYFNEFFSSEFVSFQLKHGFNSMNISKSIQPSLVVVTRMAWGDMQNPETQLGIPYKTLNQGFYESGLELNHIFKGFGFGGYYRYGPNGLSSFTDNLAIKLTYVLGISL